MKLSTPIVSCKSCSCGAAIKDRLELILAAAKAAAAEQPMFVEGRSVSLSLVPGLQTLKLVLPEYVYGRKLALRLGENPGAQYVITSVAFGELEPSGE